MVVVLLEACLATHRENWQGVVVGGGAPGGLPGHTQGKPARGSGGWWCFWRLAWPHTGKTSKG